MELVHWVDCHWEFYSINLILWQQKQFIQLENKFLNIFTDILILSSFQVQSELSHSIDYGQYLYSINLIYDKSGNDLFNENQYLKKILQSL